MAAKRPDPVVEIVHRNEQHIRPGRPRLAKREGQQESKATKPDADESKELQYRKSLSCQAEEQRVFPTTGTVLASVRTSSRTVPWPGSGMSTVTKP